MKPINSFVAMFDFLGFKNLRNEKGSEGIYKLYKQILLPQIQHAAALKGKTVQRDGSSVYVPDFGPQSVTYNIISDSIFLFAVGIHLSILGKLLPPRITCFVEALQGIKRR